jgi:hypothetical protein
MRAQIVMPVLEYAVAFALCGTACSVNEQHSIEPMNQSLSATQNEIRPQGELSLDIGGALSKEFKRDLKYHPLKASLVSGTNSASVQLGKNLVPDKFVVGAESTQGKAILQVLDAAQPWNWQGLKAVPFANAVYFNGNAGGNAWKYVSVYPDTKLESLLVRLRKELERR